MGLLENESDDEDLESYVITYTDGSTEDISATDLDDAWDWAEAYADGRKIKTVKLED